MDGGFCQSGATRSRRVIHAVTLTADDKQRQHAMRRPQRGSLAGRAPLMVNQTHNDSHLDLLARLRR